MRKVIVQPEAPTGYPPGLRGRLWLHLCLQRYTITLELWSVHRAMLVQQASPAVTVTLLLLQTVTISLSLPYDCYCFVFIMCLVFLLLLLLPFPLRLTVCVILGCCYCCLVTVDCQQVCVQGKDCHHMHLAYAGNNNNNNINTNYYSYA